MRNAAVDNSRDTTFGTGLLTAWSYTTTCLFLRLMTAGLVDGLQCSACSVKSVVHPGTKYAVLS